MIEAYEAELEVLYIEAAQLRDSVDYALLERRIGRDAMERRLTLQLAYVEKTLGIGLGLLALGPFVEKMKVLPRVLRMVGLLERGRENARKIQVEHNTVTLPAGCRELDGFTLLHLTDLHFEYAADVAGLVAEKIRGLSYDLCVLTGDFRYRTYGPHEPSMKALQELMQSVSAPAYAVLGNHDAIEMVSWAEQIPGLEFLVNEGAQILHGAKGELFVAGVDDLHYYQAADVGKALHDRVRSDVFTLLLSHSSETYAEAEDHAVDLLLCGHTHGGQICLPKAVPILNSARAPRRWVTGAWRHQGVQGYTSRGSGCVGTPVRFRCPPEITLHTLRYEV